MREAFQVELSAQRLFEARTIAQLATTIEADMQPRFEELLKLVEELSEEEIDSMLLPPDRGPKRTGRLV